MAKAEDAALDAATKLLAGDVEGEETPSGEETDEISVTSHTDEETVTDPFHVEIPQDLLDELEEPEEVDFLGQASEEIDEELDEYSELSDTERDLLKRARAAEKKAAFYENLRLKKDKKEWLAEAAKFFPLAEPFLDDALFEKTNSRRSVLKNARAIHEKLKPKVDAALKSERERLTVERQTAREEEKKAAKEAWGDATVDAPAVPSEVADTQKKIEDYRARRDLTGALKTMMFPPKEQ